MNEAEIARHMDDYDPQTDSLSQVAALAEEAQALVLKYKGEAGLARLLGSRGSRK